MLKGVFALKETALDTLKRGKKKEKKNGCRDETQIKVEMF